MHLVIALGISINFCFSELGLAYGWDYRASINPLFFGDVNALQSIPDGMKRSQPKSRILPFLKTVNKKDEFMKNGLSEGIGHRSVRPRKQNKDYSIKERNISRELMLGTDNDVQKKLDLALHLKEATTNSVAPSQTPKLKISSIDFLPKQATKTDQSVTKFMKTSNTEKAQSSSTVSPLSTLIENSLPANEGLSKISRLDPLSLLNHKQDLSVQNINVDESVAAMKDVKDGDDDVFDNYYFGDNTQTSSTEQIKKISSQSVSSTPTSPTNIPSIASSLTLSNKPSLEGSFSPVILSSHEPTSIPSFYPTQDPTVHHSGFPSVTSTSLPSDTPSINHSGAPSIQSSTKPSTKPSIRPSVEPTIAHSQGPSALSSLKPSALSSVMPSMEPSFLPTKLPSLKPSIIPSTHPSLGPSQEPTAKPSVEPSGSPTSVPSLQPSAFPSLFPSQFPSENPSHLPSSFPSLEPSNQPSLYPSIVPSVMPSSMPSFLPTLIPSTKPSLLPSTSPSTLPSSIPSSKPSLSPSTYPSLAPSLPYSLHNTGVFIRLESITEKMNENVTKIFEHAAVDFVKMTMPEVIFDKEGLRKVKILEVNVISQSMLDIFVQKTNEGNSNLSGDKNKNNRRAQANEPENVQDLNVELEITGLVFPMTPPEGFSFSRHVLTGFRNNFTDFTELLSQSDGFFMALDPSSIMGKGGGITRTPVFISSVTVGAALIVIGVIGYIAFYRNDENSERYHRTGRPITTRRRFGPLSPMNSDLNQEISLNSDFSPKSPNAMEIGRQSSVFSDEEVSIPVLNCFYFYPILLLITLSIFLHNFNLGR